MYLSHFGLTQSPFGITPNTSFFYRGSKRGEILDALIYAVTHGEGILKVTGEIGSGKTMLCRMLENRLSPSMEVIYLVNPTLSRDEVLHAIASELGLLTEGKRVDEVIRLIQHELIKKHTAGKQVVLLIEEAQAMPLDTLEEIRLLSNLETEQHKLLQIVLFGQPELDQNLNLPQMRQLKERITHHFKVPPLEQATLPEYLMFRLRAAGYHGPDIFSRGALKLFRIASGGIVRRINILADKALLAAFAENTHAIQPKHVKAAIQDSEFCKAPSIFAVCLRSPRNIVLALAILALLLSLISFAAIAPDSKTLSPLASSHKTTAGIPSTTATPSPETGKGVTGPRKEEMPVMQAPGSRTGGAGTSTNSIVRQRLTATEAWLKNQNPQHFSIQIALVEAGNFPQVERFLRKIPAEIDMEHIYIYSTWIGVNEMFGVSYNSYASRTEALATLAKLSERWGYRPQLRTIEKIRRDGEKSQAGRKWH